MGLIPQAKCSRCDRKYSGLRSRCPYCGARRRKKGKRVSDTDNATWKLIIGIILVVVLIAAVVVILVTSLSGSNEEEANNNPDVGSGFSSNEGVNSITGGNSEHEGVEDPGTDPNGGSDPDGEPTSDPEPDIETVAIYTAYGSQTTDFTVHIGGSEQLSCRYTPEDIEATPVWESSDESVFVVLQTGKVTAVGRGIATLTVTVNGVSTECIVRVNG
ncbi:MAG: Ig-like domain-containing protein [Oscillospiraceae bacterium]